MSNRVFKVIVTVVFLGFTAFMLMITLPVWIRDPSGEASSSAYLDASKVFDRAETNSYDSSITSNIRGDCPAIAMETAKALNDGRLTHSEVHQLRRRAQAFYDTAVATTARNSALEAAGQKPKDQGPDCPGGDNLFTYDR